MWFLGGIWRKYGNVKPRFNFGTTPRLVSTKPEGGICLEDIKQRGTLEQKKSRMRQILKAMAWRMSQGYLSGCMDPTKILIRSDILKLPNEEGNFPTYLSSVENLAIYLHDNDVMSTRESMKFEDFKNYASLLSNKRHLALLAGHPHLQTKMEERDYITVALDQLVSIPPIPNVKFPNNHFPPLPPDCHQVPLALAVKCHPQLQTTWMEAYETVCITREINIKASIEGASKKFKDNYYYKHKKNKPKRYENHNAIDELYYYSNMNKHACEYGDDKIVDTLHDKFPFNTTEMFKFHWTYDKHAMGTVDLEDLMCIMTRMGDAYM